MHVTQGERERGRPKNAGGGRYPGWRMMRINLNHTEAAQDLLSQTIQEFVNSTKNVVA